MKVLKFPFLSSLSYQNYNPAIGAIEVVRLQWWGGGGRVNWRCSDSSLPKLICRNEHHRVVPYVETKPPPLVRRRVVPESQKTRSDLELPWFDSLSPFIHLRNWEHYRARLVETKLLSPISPATVAGITETHRALWASPLRFSLLMLRLSDPWPPMCSPCWGGQDGALPAPWNSRTKEVRRWRRGGGEKIQLTWNQRSRSNNSKINGSDRTA